MQPFTQRLGQPFMIMNMRNMINSIQLSPEGKVDSGGYKPRHETSRYIYVSLFTDPQGDGCFSIYQIRWIKKCRFIDGHNFFF